MKDDSGDSRGDSVMRRRTKRILLVEDETIIALSEAQILEKRGYETITANSGEDAIEIIRSSPVDLVLMDIDLGAKKMDGTETASRILQKHELPIVFLSSHTEPQVVERTERITSYGYVVKNSGENVLDASIKMAFKLFDAHQKVKKHRAESEEAVRQISLREERLEHINRVLLSMRSISQIVTKDPNKIQLLDESCRFLVDQSGYSYALVVLLENGVPKEPFFHHGINKSCLSGILKKLKSGTMPYCAVKALSTRDIIITDNSEKECHGCPLQGACGSDSADLSENACMTARITHADQIYGWLSVSIPISSASEQDEHELFREIVDDIGYALHKNEIEKEKDEAFLELSRKTQERESILDSLVEHVIFEDTNLGIIWPNKAACDSVGMKREDLIGKHCYEIWPQRDTPCEDCPVMEALKTGKSQEIEKSTPDGKSWFIRGNPVKDDKGHILGAVELTLDITENKRSKEKFQQLTERMTLATYSAGIGVWDLDLRTDEMLWDDRMFRLYGVKPEAFKGDYSACKSSMHPDDLDRVDEEVTEAIQGEKEFNTQFRIITPEGEVKHLRAFAKVIRDNKGQSLRMIGVNYDITDRIQIEENLRNERRRLSDVLDGTNVGSWEWNIQTGETVFNERWAQIIGYTLKEISPTNIQTWINFVHPEDLKRSKELLEKHFRGETDYYEFEARMKHKDGHWVWVLDRGKVATWTDEGKPLLISGTHQDITERKQANEALYKTIKEKENLLMELQHRVKNSFNLIISMLNLTSGTVESNEAKDMLRMISSRVSALSELYTLLYQSGSIHNVQVTVYCMKVVSTIKNLSRGVKIHTDIEDFEVPVREATSIGLILTELMTNAINHAFSETEEGWIKIRLKKEGKCIQLKVENNGRPLPEGFEMQPSKGIGLQLVRALTKQHDGSFHISRGETTTMRAELRIQ